MKIDPKILWCPVPIPSFIRPGPTPSHVPAKRIRLFVQTYQSGSPARQKELEHCLKGNKALPFLEVIEVPSHHRLTFHQFFTLANADTDDATVSIFANSDILFDRTLELVRWMKANDAWCLTRWRTDRLWPDGHDHRGRPSHAVGADAWAVRGRVRDVPDCDFGMGLSFCDYAIFERLRRAGYGLMNPCWSVRSMHYHGSGHRTYSLAERVPGPWVYRVPATHLNGWAPKAEVSVSVSSSPDPFLDEKLCRRAKANFKNAASFAKTALRGMVDKEVQEARAETCKSCDMLCKDEKGDFCGMCGCSTGGTGKIVDLTLYKEGDAKTEKLCTHPRRGQGSGWKD